MSDPKFNREKERRRDVVRLRGAEPISTEHWETGGTPIGYDLTIRRKEGELLTVLREETRKLAAICREGNKTPTQASRLHAQATRVKEIKGDILERKLFVGTPEMLAARTWIDISMLFIELLESGHTRSSIHQSIVRVSKIIVERHFFKDCRIPDEEVKFLHHYMPLYLKMSPIRNDLHPAAQVLRYLQWRFPNEKFSW
ncbi:MAG: hypothetical protein Q7S40_29335 [Opitutaceae bacterium]|nr:hypothetical protein [Opitutaceae bacterium]